MTDPINRMEIDLEATKAYAREKAMTDKLDQIAEECFLTLSVNNGRNIDDVTIIRNALREAIKASGEDARRYQFLRERIAYEQVHNMARATLEWDVEVWSLSPPTLDAAIDAALAAHGRTV